MSPSALADFDDELSPASAVRLISSSTRARPLRQDDADYLPFLIFSSNHF